MEHRAQPTQTISVMGTELEVPHKYSLIKPVGSGAYGVVISVLDKTNGHKVAIKKVSNVFKDLMEGKRMLREIKLLRQFKHENIIGLVDILPPSGVEWEDLYLVTDLMETDLHRIIYSKQSLSLDHVQYFIYQILRALKYMHSAGVTHRDLKPSNILVNSNCELKVCDLGLARGLDENADLTEYVVTRWYRAPEIMLSCKEYTQAIDVWSAGCILAELLDRQPLFPGKDYLDQLRLICKKLGKPEDHDLTFVTSEKAKSFILRLPDNPKRPFGVLFPTAGPVACDMLSHMLAFSPHQRHTVDQVLAHAFLESLHEPTDEPPAGFTFDYSYEEDSSLDHQKLRDLVWDEMAIFHPAYSRPRVDHKRGRHASEDEGAASPSPSPTKRTSQLAPGTEMRHHKANGQIEGKAGFTRV